MMIFRHHIPSIFVLIVACSLLTSESTLSESALGAEKKRTSSNPQTAQKMNADQRAFFENKIRPVLVKQCYGCHSTDAEEIGGKLLLDSQAAMLKGGEAGPVLTPGSPEKSLLIQALKYDGLEMPPEEPLSESVINDFTHWIKMGAPDPRKENPKDDQNEETLNDPNKKLWSLLPIQNRPIPNINNSDWSRDSLDNFILAKIEAANLSPTVDAAPAVLLRRLYFDLIGLPPTKEETDNFINDYSERGSLATEKVVDELLSSSHFGERWGRHWLDVARYGESNGNDGLSRNPTFPHAWRYRDYVISAFNSDTPYDQFLTEQIAGDLLPSNSPAEHDRHLIATSFLALAAKPASAMNTNFKMDVVADQIDVIGTGIMGISVACARCHDHKFDPIPTSDYYALAGIFTSTETMWGVAANEKLTAPATDLHVLKSHPKVLPPKDFVETVLVLESATGIPKPIPKSKWKPGTPLSMGARDRKKPTDAKVNIKGDSKKLGDVAPRGFLSACEMDEKASFLIPPGKSGRVQLANWLVDNQHPLTARVMANRIWLHLFGDGIVRTPNDFGIYGERPTHPELLDHLATRFMQEGWSMKRLIKTIVLSRTYGLSSHAEQETLKADPLNLLLTRHKRRRLDAESLRDSMLKVSGQLDPKPGEGSLIRHRDILVNLAGNLHEPSNKRSIYLCYLRSSPPPTLAAFDLPDFSKPTGQRIVSTVSGQALHLFNNTFVIEQAKHFAQLVTSRADKMEDRIQVAYCQAFNREPRPQEIEQAEDLLKITQYELKSEEKAWASLAQALLITNEFRYID